MQNARSGHILLSNDFKLQHSVLLGIFKGFSLSVKSFLDMFEDPSKITFDATILGSHSPDHNSLELAVNLEGVLVNSDQLEKYEKAKKYFERRGAKFNLIKPIKSNQDSLLARSTLYDVFCTEKAILSSNVAPSTLFDFNCPVLLLSERIEQIEHLYFIFDGTPGSVIGLKKFIKLFSQQISNAKLTTLLINDFSDDEVFNEKIIIDFLLANFIDVGVVLTTKKNVDSDLDRLINTSENPFVITGLAGAKSIISKNVCNLNSNTTPLFFSKD